MATSFSQEKRHLLDGLYDIPIYGTHPNLKINTIDDNYILPKINYLSQNKVLASSSITPKRLNKKVSPPLLPTFKRNPYNMNHIPNKCLTLILRENTYRDQKMNVILRKQQKHSYLAEFHYACCCSPVPSTFITSIKNNHFIT